jgi:iron(III) transport system permease protein
VIEIPPTEAVRTARPVRRFGVAGRLVPALTIGPVLVYIPVIITFWSAFKPTGLVQDPGFTLDNFVQVYTDKDFPGLVWRTLVFSIGSSVFALLLAIPVTWILERTNIPLRRVLRALVVLALAMPPLLLAMSWVFLLHPRAGMVNILFRNLTGLDGPLLDIHTMGGMIFVQGLALVPTTYLILAPAFRNMDPSLEEAARTSGAGLFAILFKVTLPVLRPAILSAFVLLIIVGFVVLDIPGIIGVPVREFVLSSQLFTYLSVSPSGLPRYGFVGALAVSFVALLLLLGLVYQRLTRASGKFVTITGKGFRPSEIRLGKLRPWALALVVVYISLAVILPVLVLLWTSFTPFVAPFSFDKLSLLTFKNFVDVFTSPLVAQAFSNSLIVAPIAATVVAALSAVISWIVVRSKAWGRRVIDLLSFLPVAIAGAVLGSALVTTYLNIHVVQVYGTIWIIAIAFVTAYLSYGTRALNSVVAQIHPDLEQAAYAAGAGWWRTFRTVTFRLIFSAVVGVWIWVAAHALRDVSAPLLLRGKDNSVVATLLWDYWVQGRPSTASAVGVLLIGMLAILVTIWQLVETRNSASKTSKKKGRER